MNMESSTAYKLVVHDGNWAPYQTHQYHHFQLYWQLQLHVKQASHQTLDCCCPHLNLPLTASISSLRLMACHDPMAVHSSAQVAAVSLLQLPDPCLPAVLRCCDTHSSICSAARAHSRLHQAAIEALTSITLDKSQSSRVLRQPRLDSLVDVYLPRYGQHVDSIDISLNTGRLRQLPTTLTKLTSLTAKHMDLQLLPGCGYPGVLGAAVTPPLKRLRLNGCYLMSDYEEGLTAALALLPGLEHLSITDSNMLRIAEKERATGGGNVLRQLQQLTYLELSGVWVEAGDPEGVDLFKLQDLTALTRLADLRLLWHNYPCSITASMMSSAQRLTRLQLETARLGGYCFEPGALAGKTLLQHLELQRCNMVWRRFGVARLLSELPKLQQLTSLVLSCTGLKGLGAPAAAAYSALTASSKLQRLDLSAGSFPAGVLQHVFPEGRQLPHLRELDISDISKHLLTAAEGSSLVSCCPGLQSLDMRHLQCSTEMLGALQGLSSLSSLSLQPPAGSEEEWEETVEGVSQLTGLRRLELWQQLGIWQLATQGLALQLTQLQQLTYLQFSPGVTVAGQHQQRGSGHDKDVSFCCAVSPNVFT